MKLWKLTKKQVIRRVMLLPLLLIAGFVWLCVRACPESNYRLQIPPEAGDGDTANLTQEQMIPPPEGYTRVPAAEDSFLQFMRNMPCWPEGSSIMTFDGKTKSSGNAAAVYTLTLPDLDYQQCADTIMRLWGDYFMSTEQYDRIAFSYSNGYETKFTEWLNGKRYVTVPVINLTFRMKLAKKGEASALYGNYMQSVMRYAGTLSLDAESHPIKASEAHAGDIICHGGAPGHAVVIVDEAENEAGERCFLLAQGFIPSVSAHILAGYKDQKNPWYTEAELAGDTIRLCSWTFSGSELRRWKEGFAN